MKRKHKLLFGLFVILAIIVLYALYAGYYYFNPAMVEHPLYVEITSENSSVIKERIESGKRTVFVYPSSRAIPFYFLGANENLTRGLEIRNIYDFSVQVDITAEGSITQFLTISDNEIRLLPKTNTTIWLDVRIPENPELGNYTGVLMLKYHRK